MTTSIYGKIEDNGDANITINALTNEELLKLLISVIYSAKKKMLEDKFSEEVAIAVLRYACEEGINHNHSEEVMIIKKE